MRKEERIFLDTLKAAIYEERFCQNLDHMSQQEWERLEYLSEIHQVVPMIYDRLRTFDIPDHLRNQWKHDTLVQSVNQMQVEEAFGELYEEMIQKGFSILVFKGVICRNLYPFPAFRISGDEDLLIKKEQFAALDDFLVRKGFTREEEFDPEAAEIGYRNFQMGLYLEIHTKLFSETSVYSFLNTEFEHVFDRQIVISIKNHAYYTFSETDHLLYLICHSYKHFLHGGFGIRQLCDMVLFMHVYGNQIDYRYFDQKLEKYHLLEFWANLLDIANQYLGFSYVKAGCQKLPIKTDSEPLLMDILEGGVFGGSTMERRHSANMTLTALEGSHPSNVGGIVHSLLPNVVYMKQQFSYLKSKPYLLPVAYLHRIFSYGKRNRHLGALSSVEIGKKRVELLKKYKLIR